MIKQKICVYSHLFWIGIVTGIWDLGIDVIAFKGAIYIVQYESLRI